MAMLNKSVVHFYFIDISVFFCQSQICVMVASFAAFCIKIPWYYLNAFQIIVLSWLFLFSSSLYYPGVAWGWSISSYQIDDILDSSGFIASCLATGQSCGPIDCIRVKSGEALVGVACIRDKCNVMMGFVQENGE